ncbi:2-amino-4-hydroxy-6-hydroxymethyldihydropteridine diphosphokinase [Nevskia sp.]|uniref:2-amino-4-hydroxy-6- hydroxymethyldihydropteridine diphosphokinase n=1 Tax=Nevskia sp. TaxID=1929292 RepID=UPI0025EB2D75|nr:2-amino-4-hydroxy-6-hydroxymethyldihydropteridine diphosphokinase [Nevskia sp.]
MFQAWLGLGANLGDPVAQLERAFAQIAALPETRLIARSSLYRSDPVGPAGQPDYCNAVCQLETALSPEALLDAVLAIEVDNGRVRDGIRWAARLLDIDLLHVDGIIRDTKHLSLPHPHLHERNWVAVPLAEIAPQLVIPGIGAISALAERLGRAGLRRWAV